MGAPTRAYLPFVKLAAGGTATVFVGVRASHPEGELVALKRPHPHVLDDPRQRAALLREARIASTIRHPNVVPVREVEESENELELVMDYVEGASLASLIAGEASRGARVPTAIAVRVLLDAAAGLAAVHAEADAQGKPLGLVHRDVSPQNILVGTDGVARLTDFGLAKAIYEGAPSTTQGTLKGKLGYMAPEYVSRGRIDASGDLFALGVVAWETLAGRRLFRGDNEAQTLDRVLREDAPRLAEVAAELAPFDDAIARSLAKDPSARVASASVFAEALTHAASARGAIASPAEVGAYVARVALEELSERRARIDQARAEIRLRARARRVRVGGAVALVGAAGASIAFLLGGHSHGPTDAAPIAPVAAASSALAPSDSAAPLAATDAALPDAAPPPALAPSASAAPSAPPRSPPRRHAPSAPAAPTRVPPPNPYVSTPSTR